VSCAPERSGFPSRAGAAGSNHLPWALLRILPAIPKIKSAPSGSGRPAARGRDLVCSKDARDAFGPGKHGSAFAAEDAERPRGDGRGGRPGENTGRRLRAEKNGTGKAGATGSASETERHQKRK
jgi:hypothetical protein